MKYKQAIFTLLVTLMFCVAVMPAQSASVSMGGRTLTLLGATLEVGKPLPEISLPDSGMNMTALQSLKGRVAILSVVPSIDTKVCEKQTHILSEENEGLDAQLLTISRDLPFAQKRFAKEAKIANLTFLSDYRDGSFGQATGLLIEESRLLTRAVIVVDKEGIIRHLEIVPDLRQLPDMKKAFQVARKLN